MPKQTIKRTDFHNPTSKAITFILGTSPNDYPEEVTVQPGETHKGFANYKNFYARHGLAVGPAPGSEKVMKDAIKASAEAAIEREKAEQAKLEAAQLKAEADQVRADAELSMAEAKASEASAAAAKSKKRKG